MEHMVTQYFRGQLKHLGYDVKDIEWSLGHCQGDGMAFYGDLSGSGLIAVARRVMRGTGRQKFAAYRAINKGCGVAIERNDYGRHYAHYNTMSVHDKWDSDEMTADEEEAFCSLVAAIDDDIRVISRRLADDGYAILEAFRWEKECMRTFSTANFELRIIEVPESPDNMMHDEYDDQAFTSLIAGKWRITGVRAEIWQREDGEAVECLGDATLMGVWVEQDSSDRTYGGYLRGLIADAVAEARGNTEVPLSAAA